MSFDAKSFLNSKGINVLEAMPESITTWREWYKGNVSKFHDYVIQQNGHNKQKRRKTLNMAAKLSQDWADLLLNEKVAITVNTGQDTLDRLLAQTNFFVKGNNLIEESFAIGGGFLIQFWDGHKTSQKYITQDMMLPITADVTGLKEAAFFSQTTVRGETYDHIEVHTLDNKNEYVIDNFFIKDGREITVEGVDEKWETHSKYPLFQMIRPNIVNRENFNSSYGASVYSTALDTLKSCDTVYDSYYNEIVLGKKRVYAKQSVTSVSIDPDTGETHEYFNTDDDLFYMVPGDDEDGQPITESNMSLRVPELDQALQRQLNTLSQLCGFGNERYQWSSGSVATATQVISEESDMFRTMQKHEGLLRQALTGMVRGLFVVEQAHGGDCNPDTEITIDFDDSIIEDTAEKKRQAMQDYSMQLISLKEYFKETRGYNDEQAEKFAAQMIEERNKELAQMQIESEPMPE